MKSLYMYYFALNRILQIEIGESVYDRRVSVQYESEPSELQSSQSVKECGPVRAESTSIAKDVEGAASLRAGRSVNRPVAGSCGSSSRQLFKQGQSARIPSRNLLELVHTLLVSLPFHDFTSG